MRIEVGRGLEGVVTDAEASSIIHTRMIPYLRSGDYSAAIQVAMERIEPLAREEVFPVEQAPIHDIGWLGMIIWCLFIFGWVFLSMFAGTKEWWLGGVFGAIIGAVSYWWIGILIGVFIGLCIDYLASRYLYDYVRSRSTYWNGSDR